MGLNRLGEMLSDRIGNIVQEIYNAVGYEFNLNSPKQLGEALFDKLGLPARKKRRAAYSTNAEVLESLANEQPGCGADSRISDACKAQIDLLRRLDQGDRRGWPHPFHA